MQIPTQYKGPIYFYSSAKYGGITVSDYGELPVDQYILLGQTEVDVQFDDVRDEMVRALEEQVKKERAESRHRIDMLEGKIKNLLALENQEA